MNYHRDNRNRKAVLFQVVACDIRQVEPMMVLKKYRVG